MRNFRLGRSLAVAATAALCACERGEPSPAASAPPAAEIAAAEPTGVVVIPPFDPSLPPLQLEIPPTPEPQIAAPRAESAPSRAPSRRAEAPVAAAEPARPPLDALLRAPYRPYQPPGEPTTVDLGAPAAPAAPIEPKPPRALDRLGQSIRLERRGEVIGPAGPRQGTVWETEAGLRIPVDPAVSLEGGVRVDTRDEPGVKEPQRRPTPRVGVEVRF